MAVEAHHLLHTNAGGAGQSQKLAAINAGWEGGGGGCYDASTSPLGRCYYGAGGDVAELGRQSQQLAMQHQQQKPSSCVDMAAVSGLPMTTVTGQYNGRQADASESGVTFGGGGAQEAMMMAPCRKRKRAAELLGGLVADGVAAHLQQQLVDVDRLVVQHTARMWAELTEHRRRHARQLVAAVESAAAKRLRAKDEEIARVGRLNWALEERVRSLLVEAQVWRDLAHANEAAATALRADLQNALDAQQAHRRGVVANQAEELPGGAAADDAASCCCGENDVAGVVRGGDKDEEEVATTTTAAAHRLCRVCGEGAAEVLLLPCRHLCACAACADRARACPACGCAKNGSVCVNFS